MSVADHPSTGPERPIDTRQRGALRWLLRAGQLTVFALAVWITYGECTQPKVHSVRTEGGRSYDVLGISRDSGTGALFMGPRYAHREVILVNYYAASHDLAGATDEMRDLLGVATRAADSSGDSVVVFQRTVPLGFRWTRLITGQLFAFQRIQSLWYPVDPR